MAHHHRTPNHPHDEGSELGEFKVDSTVTTKPNLNHTSREVEKEKEDVVPQEKKKSIFDYEIAGLPWSLVLVMSAIAIGILVLLLKVMGVF